MVDRIVAMDVGPPVGTALGFRFMHGPILGRIRMIVTGVLIGSIYQYSLIVGFLCARILPSPLDRWIGDIFPLFWSWLAKFRLRNNLLGGDRITADACYPYFYFHLDLIYQIIGLRSSPPYRSVKETPSCPTLFLYGTGGIGKPPLVFRPALFHLPEPGNNLTVSNPHTPITYHLIHRGLPFHDTSWEAVLKTREDCEVVPCEGAGHWIQHEQPDLVNSSMERWLKKTPGFFTEASPAAAAL